MVRKTSLLAATTTLAVSAAISTISHAAVSADEARQLGGSRLTSFGAERAGNKEGTIPEYTGQAVSIPGYSAKDPGYRPNPFSDEKPLYTITAQNADKYADKLDGQLQLFKLYPNYRMDIYPTRRNVTFPRHVIDNTLKNATSCKAVQNELVLEGCYGGTPFPIPKTGYEVMWNHLMGYEFVNSSLNTLSYLVPPSGKPVLSNGNVGSQSTPIYESTRTTPASAKDIYWRVRLDYNSPTRAVGEKLVVIDAMDPVNVGRRAYQYVPGQRRVKLAPDLAYDTPNPATGGSQTMDDTKAFSGAMDRFEFKLIGKKEKFLPYNSFKAVDKKECPVEKILTKNFPNPDCIRYELHRVWVVEATLKPGFRHIYQKRRFFWDEDGFVAGTTENYDASGKLYRMIAPLQYPYPEGGAHFSTYLGYDFQTGAWSALGLTSFDGGGFFAIPPKPGNYFSPEALAGEGVR